MQMNVDPTNSCPINIVQAGDNNYILFQLKNTCPREDTTTGNSNYHDLDTNRLFSAHLSRAFHY